MDSFGASIRAVRVGLSEQDSRFSVRQVAAAVGIEPAYLSKIERGVFSPPSEQVICRIAAVLGEDEDVLLAMAGKLSSELQRIILRRPKLFAELIRELKNAPDHAVLRVAREVKDGKW
ncbi:MAG: XRE family transcriptional regulator [Cytophagaceae bacterium]|nr:MAG: XRE family transcriptional regulator [Cytophagaceae bacterium]